MLGDRDVMATVAVKSLDAALPFYEHMLGMTTAEEEQSEHGVIGLKAGAGVVLVYESEFARTNQATVLTWALGEDFDAEVAALQAKGVVFETYDLPGARMEGPVHVMGDMKVVWFKDPDGNILSAGNY
jgi:catechol 2,3-dioxygenase-like lactoylglutathione lyase family enzyme